MGYIQGQERSQQVLVPESRDDDIDAAHPVRFLDVFVKGLARKALGFTHATPHQTGRPSYPPGAMLKLSLWVLKQDALKAKTRTRTPAHPRVAVVVTEAHARL